MPHAPTAAAASNTGTQDPTIQPRCVFSTPHACSAPSWCSCSRESPVCMMGTASCQPWLTLKPQALPAPRSHLQAVQEGVWTDSSPKGPPFPSGQLSHHMHFCPQVKEERTPRKGQRPRGICHQMSSCVDVHRKPWGDHAASSTHLTSDVTRFRDATHPSCH